MVLLFGGGLRWVSRESKVAGVTAKAKKRGSEEARANRVREGTMTRHHETGETRREGNRARRRQNRTRAKQAY